MRGGRTVGAPARGGDGLVEIAGFPEAGTTAPDRNEGFLCVCMSEVTFFRPLVTLSPLLRAAKSWARLASAAEAASSNKLRLGIGGGGGPGGGGGGGGPPAEGFAAAVGPAFEAFCIASPPGDPEEE